MAKEIKGRSSRILREKIPHLREWCESHLWASGGYHGSVGWGWELVGEIYFYSVTNDRKTFIGEKR